MKNVIETRDAHWCTIPRVASNTVSRALEPDRVSHPMEPRDVKPGKQVYAIIRHPRERFVSAIAFLQQGRRYRFKVRRPPRSAADILRFDRNTTPEQVIDLVEAGHADIHFQAQSDYIVPGATLFQYEGTTWRAMLRDPPILNAVEHLSAEEWCRPRTLRRIDTLYAADLLLWTAANG